MPRVAVVTATKRHGGLDVTYESLCWQTYDDFIWIIADELYYDRRYLYADKIKEVNFSALEPHPKPQGWYSDLPAIYNRATRVAKGLGCELVVSLQDYIFAPADGIEKFVDLYDKLEGKALITGLCSMLRRPTAESVVDPRGLWTIFRECYKPERWSADLEWPDVRASLRPSAGRCTPVAWEMNWALYPVGIPEFDESYGKHIGHENQQFAWDAYLKEGLETFIDPTNHALSLPHRHYFPEEWESQKAHRDANQTFHKGLYGQVESIAFSEHQG